jgi:hypothetical protein
VILKKATEAVILLELAGYAPVERSALSTVVKLLEGD